jgi:mannonate dehydratase
MFTVNTTWVASANVYPDRLRETALRLIFGKWWLRCVSIVKLRLAEILLEGSPTQFWDVLKQLGVEEATGILPRAYPDWRQWRYDEPWDYASLSSYKRSIEDYGFRLTVIEDNPPMDKIKYGLPGRDEQLDSVAKLIENMGKLSIPIWVYNWMPTMWERTRRALRGRGGSIVGGFSVEDLEGAPPPKLGRVEAATLWRTLKEFLEFIVPVAEASGVKLAMHPDDPPVEELQGTARIMNSVEAYDRLLELAPSEHNGITLCQGNFTLMTGNLAAVVAHFLKTGKVFFVHFRDVKGNKQRFVETFIDEGMTNLYATMREYVKHDYSGPFRVDHTPTLSGDTAQISAPGYSALGRIHAIGYIQGLFKAAVSEQTNA